MQTFIKMLSKQKTTQSPWSCQNHSTVIVFLEIYVFSIPTEDRLEDRTLQDEAVTLADLEESPAYQESQGSHLQSMGYRDSQESQPQPKRSKTPVMELSAELSKLQESLRESDGKSL